ncbi:terpenoid cyclases/protein prenyltransferase alpha-alpha toroid [Cladorrhinum sp. PSN332]|nr:terpenoid cyclases/protein prenyltransferase alpha-alpha toroid [Cladorrhinum sp. PSN332]
MALKMAGWNTRMEDHCNNIIDIPCLHKAAEVALDQALSLSFKLQNSDGHWSAPVSADATSTAQYIFLKTHSPQLNILPSSFDLPLVAKYFFATQSPADGGWRLAPSLPCSNLSTTIEVYLALRILGVPSSHPALLLAKEFILANGGIAKCRFVTAFFLASFGLVPWSSIPQLPPEIILFLTWFKFNIYVIASTRLHNPSRVRAFSQRFGNMMFYLL